MSYGKSGYDLYHSFTADFLLCRSFHFLSSTKTGQPEAGKLKTKYGLSLLKYA
jgi:hypothetical protein